MAIVQSFCTVNEILDGSELRGSKRESEIFEKIISASQLLAMRVGRFLPVIETRKTNANKPSRKLFLPFPLLSVTTLVNDDTTLTSADYILQPDGAHWDNGPYSMLEVDSEATNLFNWCMEANEVIITGQMGLYSSALATGATLGASLTDSGTTLQVSNAAKISAGGVYLVGSEWVFVREVGTPVAAVTTLSASVDANAGSGTVASGAALNVGEVIRIDGEQLRILDINSNTVYWERGWNKTTKASHSNGANVDVYRKFTIERGVNGSTAAAHTSGDALTRQIVPSDVNELTRKIATRMLKDASTGYQARVGDDATGQSMYTYVLPLELDEVMERYRIPQVG